MNISDIRPLIGFGNHSFDIRLGQLEKTLGGFIEEDGLELCPDFQRGHVWSEDQQSKFVEFILRGGRTQPFLFNHPAWPSVSSDPSSFVCVDGLQRITALRKFLSDQLSVFRGHTISQIEGIELPLKRIHLTIYINTLKTRREVLEWYLELNDGGTPHTTDELHRVRSLLCSETTASTLSS